LTREYVKEYSLLIAEVYNLEHFTREKNSAAEHNIEELGKLGKKSFFKN
jgi:hypothetical protein